MLADEHFLPDDPSIRALYLTLTSEVQQRRFDAARKRAACVMAVENRPVEQSERAALANMCGVDRTSLRRWRQRFQTFGLEGLVDQRPAVGRESMSPEHRSVVCTLRRQDPNIGVDAIVEHLADYHGHTSSERTVRRVLRSNGLARPPGGGKKIDLSREKDIMFGGMKLVEVAEVATGAIANMAEIVWTKANDAVDSAKPKQIDCSDRDEYGRFLSSYNSRYRKHSGCTIGPGFSSVDVKRAEKDLGGLHVCYTSKKVAEQKIMAVMVSNLLGMSSRTGMSAPCKQLCKEACGYAYKPSTLNQFMRELKFLGLSTTLWDCHATRWAKLTESWGTRQQSAALFVDGTTKPVWTSHYTQSSKVSNVGRVMPALETICFHSGNAIPLYSMTGSGRLPLVEKVPKMLCDFEKLHDNGDMWRIIVIDAEGNSIPFLRSLEDGVPNRAWVTRLRPSLLRNKHIQYTTEHTEYRNGDLIRDGFVDLNDPKSSGKRFRCRVVEIVRRTKNTVTYIGASTRLEEADWSGARLSDLYFSRWPCQELNFRAVNQATDLKRVHGHGKQLVDNVVALTEIDKLNRTIESHSAQAAELKVQYEKLQHTAEIETEALSEMARRTSENASEMQCLLASQEMDSAVLRDLADEQTQLLARIETAKHCLLRSTSKELRIEKQLERHTRLRDKQKERREQLQSRLKILRHDVELDSTISVFKCCLTILIQYILREFLGGTRMAPDTFLKRVATLPARLRLLPQDEILTFYYNEHDPEVMAILIKNCDRINALRLRARSGRILQVRVDPAPRRRRAAPGVEQLQWPK